MELCSLFISNFTFPARIGVYAHEKIVPQLMRIDLELGLNPELATLASMSDQIENTSDYDVLIRRIQELAIEKHYQLIESFAWTLVQEFDRISKPPWFDLKLAKLAPYPGAQVGMHWVRSVSEGKLK